jgi:hypothetical protein
MANLPMVKVRALEILKLRTTRKKWAKDRPTPPILASKTEGGKTESNPAGSKNSYQYGRHNWMKRPDDMTAGTGKM